jgi:hypothetical protein
MKDYITHFKKAYQALSGLYSTTWLSFLPFSSSCSFCSNLRVFTPAIPSVWDAVLQNIPVVHSLILYRFYFSWITFYPITKICDLSLLFSIKMNQGFLKNGWSQVWGSKCMRLKNFFNTRKQLTIHCMLFDGSIHYTSKVVLQNK